jgi:hypothetical protein
VRSLDELKASPERRIGPIDLQVSYQRAANCFDSRGTRILIDGANTTNLIVLPELGVARVTVAAYGLVYATMEIVGTSAATSTATAYAVEPFRSDWVPKWMDTLRACT